MAVGRQDFAPPPDSDALGYFRAKGMQPGFDWRDVWRQEHAYAFTVAKAMNVDVLQAIRDEVDKAIAEGRTFAEFKRDLTPTLQKQGWWGRQQAVDPLTGEEREVQLGSPRRLRTIYRTNLRTARSAGQHDRAQRTRDALPYFIYELGPSEVHRKEHAAVAGTIRPIDDPFWEVWDPPNGFGCKCRKRQISRIEARRRGGVSDPPKIRRRRWTNPRTGKTELIPEGIQPGFNMSWGRERKANVDRLLAGKLEAADGLLAAVATRDLVNSDGFAAWLERPTGSFPVLRIADDVAEAIGAKQRVAVLSADTMVKQAAQHPELTLEDYRALPYLGESPTAVFRQGENRVHLVRRNGRDYVAVVKTTEDREGLFVVSFRRANERTLQQLAKREELLFGGIE